MLRPIVIATILAGMGLPAQAMDYDVGSIHIAQPWTRATPKGAKSAGGYLKVTNKGTEPDRLTCVSLAAAAKCSIHEMSMERGVMKMRMLPDGLEIKPGETVELKPGSLHVMFEDLKQPLEKGQTVKGTLKLEKAGTIDVDFAVEGVGARGPEGSGAPMGGMKM